MIITLQFYPDSEQAATGMRIDTSRSVTGGQKDTNQETMVLAASMQPPAVYRQTNQLFKLGMQSCNEPGVYSQTNQLFTSGTQDY